MTAVSTNLGHARPPRAACDAWRMSTATSPSAEAGAAVLERDLLHHLWELGSLNRWGPGWQRDYWRVRRELLAAAAQTPLDGRAFSQLLYIPPEFRPQLRDEIERDWADFRAQVLETPPPSGQAPSGFILGEVKDLQPARYDGAHRLDLRHHRDALIIESELYNQVVRHNLKAIARAAQHGHAEGHVMALAQVEATHGASLRVLALTLRVCSRHFLPVESQYEAELADALVAADRAFVKPLHRGGEFPPDFVLLDTRPQTALEVMGMETVQYARHKQDKLEHLARQGLATWVWQAASGRHMPALPPAEPR